LIPTPDTFLRWLEPVHDLRRRRAPGYVTAVGGVGAATVLRLVAATLLQSVTFTTFYPVIALATLLGGARAGGLAVALSAVSANFFITKPSFAFSLDIDSLTSTAMFILAGAMLIGVVTLLNQAVDRMSQELEQTKLILEALPVGVMLVDAHGIINFVNSRLEYEVGYSREELRNQPVEMLAPEALRTRHGQVLRSFMIHPEHRRMGVEREIHAQRKDGVCIPVEIGLAPFRAFGFTGALATVIDVSERKALERREVIANEVRHRARNILTIVQLLARRTLPQREREPFMDMLQTIARTQDVLSAQSTAPLRSIIEGELGGFHHELFDAGCEIRLSPRAAQDFALIVHELTSNAVKYGALSLPEGCVEIFCRWSEGGRSFTFLWQERGGPKVEPPARRGFGSTILKDLARGFAGSVDTEYLPEGLRYELRAELARVGEVIDATETASAA
jgi:PAS domain S-box-containing protein